MKNVMRFIVLSFVVLLIQGCASHENFVQKYNAWVGRHISHFIQEIGYPDSQYDLPNKNRVYVYHKSQIYTAPAMPTFGYGYGSYYGGYGMVGFRTEVVQETCNLYVETDKEGTIVKWGSRGNSCRT
jgi:hypothetical protein